MANIHRGTDQQPFEIEDFMPMPPAKHAERQKKKEAEQERANQLKIAAALGLRPAVKPNAS